MIKSVSGTVVVSPGTAMLGKRVSMKEINDDTLSLLCVIESAQNIYNHTEYTLKVQKGPLVTNSWTVNKRYSDFAALDNKLRTLGCNLPFPPKKLIGNMSLDFIAERQKALQIYLDVLLSDHHLASSFTVRQFLDPSTYDFNVQEQALQQISMFFRLDAQWEVIGPLANIGWRIRKSCFSVKNRLESKKAYILLWTLPGPDRVLDESTMTEFLNVLSTVQFRGLYPISLSSVNSTAVIVIRPFQKKGCLQDLIYKSKPGNHFLEKYCQRNGSPFDAATILRCGRQILDILAFLHSNSIPYGHLHSGNVMLSDEGFVQLLDIENGVLGVPAYYRSDIVQLRKLNMLEQVDVYSFGRLIYEMAVGKQLDGASIDKLPDNLIPNIRSLLQTLLSADALKRSLPSVSELLQLPMFKDCPSHYSPEMKVKMSSQLKNALQEAKSCAEKRLREDQNLTYECKKIEKTQAFVLSEEEKRKRRRSQLKQMTSDTKDVSKDEPNGAEPNSLNSTSSTISSVVLPHSVQRSFSAVTFNSNGIEPSLVALSKSASSSVLSKSLNTMAEKQVVSPDNGNAGRSGLLSSIAGFNKTSLKRAVTVDKSAPRL